MPARDRSDPRVAIPPFPTSAEFLVNGAVVEGDVALRVFYPDGRGAVLRLGRTHLRVLVKPGSNQHQMRAVVQVPAVVVERRRLVT